MGDNIKVAIKVRPLIQREIDSAMKREWTVKQNKIFEINGNAYDAEFDHVFDENSSTEFVFNDAVKPVVADCLKGFNGSIVAYGQTSSGKTHIMMGNDKVPGIIQMAINEIFEEIEQQQENREFLIRVSFLEIYNEKVNDLLHPESQDLKVLEQGNGDIYIQCTECITSNPSMVMAQLANGNKNRCVGETNMNEKSSRSHTIFRVIIESRVAGELNNDAAVQIGTLNLVDLAGSEKAEQSGATGSRFKEGTFINKSLLSLSKVINQLIEQPDDQKVKHVNYRDSKLTRLLQHSLGGNAKSVIICAVTPAAAEETRSTLGFAARAKTIKNKPHVNEILTDQAMIKRLQKQIVSLEKELCNVKASNFNTKDNLLREISERQEYFIRSERRVLNTKGSTRRRTWAGTGENSVKDTDSELGALVTISNEAMSIPPSTFFASKSVQPYVYVPTAQNLDLDNEIFRPGETVDFDRIPSPTKFPLVHTPHCMQRRLSMIREYDDSPRSSEVLYKERINTLQRELDELQEFTKLEKFIHAHEDDKITCEDEINRLTNEIQTLRDDLNNANERSNSLSEELHEIKRMQNERNVEMNSLKIDKDAAIKVQMDAQKEAEDILNSKVFEFEACQTKAKNREQELLDRLNDIQRPGEPNRTHSESLVDELKIKETEIHNLQKTLEEEKSKYATILHQNELELVKMQTSVSDHEEKLRIRDSSFGELLEKIKSIEKELTQAASEPRNEKLCLKNICSLLNIQTPEISFGPDDLMCDFSLNDITKNNSTNGDAFDETLKDKLENNDIKKLEMIFRSAIDTSQMRMKTFEIDLEKRFAQMFTNIKKLEDMKFVLGQQMHMKSKTESLEETNLPNTMAKEIENLKSELKLEKNKHYHDVETRFHDVTQLENKLKKTEEAYKNATYINKRLQEEIDIKEKEFKSRQLDDLNEFNNLLAEHRKLKESFRPGAISELQNAEDKIRSLEMMNMQIEQELKSFKLVSENKEQEFDDLKAQLDALEQEKTSLQKEYDEMSNQVIDAIEESDALKSKLEETECCLKKLSDERLNLENEYSSCKANYDQCSTRLKETEFKISQFTEINHLPTNLEHSSNDTEKEKSIYEDAMSDKELADSQSYQQKIDLLTQENLELQNRLRSLSEFKNSELQDEIHALRSRLSVLMQVEDSEEKIKSDLNSKLETLQSELKIKTEQLSLMEEEAVRSPERVKGLEQEFEKVKQSNTELQKQIKYLLETLEDRSILINNKVETRMTEFKFEIDSNLEKISKLSSSLAAQTQKLSATRTQKRRLEDEANLQISAISKELEDVRNEKSVVQNQLDETRSKLLFHEEHTVPDLKRQISDLTSECNEIKVNLKVSEEKFLRTETELKSIKSELESRMNTFIQTDTKLVELEKLLDDGNQKYANVEKELAQKVEQIVKKEQLEVKLNEEVNVGKQRMLQIQQENDKIQKELASVEVKNQQTLSDYLKATQEIENLKIECSSQVHNLTAKDAAIRHLTMKLEQLTREHKSFQVEHEKAQSKNEILRLEIDEMKRVKSDDRRRSHRSSLYDSSRFFDKKQSVQTQTDPTDTSCQCIDLNDKIITLKRDNLKLQLKLDNHNLHSHYLIDKEKVKAEEWEKRTQTLKADLISAQQKIRELANCVRSCKVCDSKKPSISCAVQTIDESEVISVQSKVDTLADELAALKRKYEDTKKLCKIRNEKIKELQQSVGKENETQNCQLSLVLAENSLLKKNINELEEKYSELKRGCYAKQQQQQASLKKISSTQTTAKLVNIEQYQALEEMLQLKGNEFEMLETKYQRCKKLCVARKESHLKMEAKYAEIQEENHRLEKMLEEAKLLARSHGD